MLKSWERKAIKFDERIVDTAEGGRDRQSKRKVQKVSPKNERIVDSRIYSGLQGKKRMRRPRRKGPGR